jgi:hypothetical protein
MADEKEPIPRPGENAGRVVNPGEPGWIKPPGWYQDKDGRWRPPKKRNFFQVDPRED